VGTLVQVRVRIAIIPDRPGVAGLVPTQWLSECRHSEPDCGSGLRTTTGPSLQRGPSSNKQRNCGRGGSSRLERRESKAQGPRTSARDWLEAAGWHRLSIINRSLGEFSHIPDQAQGKWQEARAALMEVQDDLDDDAPSSPEQTTRGATLNRSRSHSAQRSEHSLSRTTLSSVLHSAKSYPNANSLRRRSKRG
jgi:hypothetical protein